MPQTRIIWIDVLKGLAIILVVIHHDGPKIISDFIACFHMPLFFLLSGWLFSPKSIKSYTINSIHRLLIPYFSFLVLVSLPNLIGVMVNGSGGGNTLIIRLLYGGYYLQGVYAVFWFITVLWMASNLFNLILNKRVRSIWLPFLIIIAYLAYLTPIPLPWNIHIVPMATVYLWIGYLLKKRENSIKKICFSQTKYTVTAVIGILLVIFILRESLTFSMKYAEFGIPGVSLVFSVVASICVAIVAIWLSTWRYIWKILTFTGLSSMAIMYLHMPVKYFFTLKIAPREVYVIHIFSEYFFH